MLPSLWEKDFHRVITRWATEHGPVFKVRIMQFHAIIVTDPALATHVCRSKLLDKMRFQYHFLDQVRRERKRGRGEREGGSIEKK